MADERDNEREQDSTRNVDRFVKRIPIPPGGPDWASDHSGGQSDDTERDPETEYLKDAARRAHDEELSALANLALIRSTLDRRNRFREEPALDREERDRRLQRILDEPDPS